MSEELKPCPFCGAVGENLLLVDDGIVCESCNAVGPDPADHPEESLSAAQLWNRREWNDIRHNRPVVTERMMQDMDCTLPPWNWRADDA